MKLDYHGDSGIVEPRGNVRIQTQTPAQGILSAMAITSTHGWPTLVGRILQLRGRHTTSPERPGQKHDLEQLLSAAVPFAEQMKLARERIGVEQARNKK